MTPGCKIFNLYIYKQSHHPPKSRASRSKILSNAESQHFVRFNLC